MMSFVDNLRDQSNNQRITEKLFTQSWGKIFSMRGEEGEEKGEEEGGRGEKKKSTITLFHHSLLLNWKTPKSMFFEAPFN